jgi:hypothetical protein
MVIVFEENQAAEALLTQCQRMAADSRIKGLLILSCDNNGYTGQQLNQGLRKIPLPLFGGIFPGIIHGNRKIDQGSLVVGLFEEPTLHTIPDLSNPAVDYESVIAQLIREPGDEQTMMVLVDGLAKRISGLIEGLFNNFSLEFNYIGAGAGSLSMVRKPCLFTNEGLVYDQAAIAMLAVQSGVGVCHGWKPLSGPFQVTESRENLVVSIDFQPAFEIYSREVNSHLNRKITPENFFSLAKNHPLGLAKLGAEKLVRDPIAVTAEGAIQCVGEVPEGAYFHILTGSPSSLVDAAQAAMRQACARFPGNPQGKPSVLIDCISRVLYLEADFQRELNALQRPGAPLVGVLSLGEIAGGGQDYLEFYNKTCVVGVIDI